MHLQDMCIELRPNLQSGFMLLKFDRNMSVDCENLFKLKAHRLHIVFNDSNGKEQNRAIIRFLYFEMDIRGLSSFLVSDTNISFRFRTQNIDVEALVEHKPAMELLQLSFAENTNLTIFCSLCLFQVVPACSYTRLREFPSCLVDPSEFFCHAHGNDKKPRSLVPQSGELFYGLNHIVLNMQALSQHTKLCQNQIYCKRCSRLLGEAMLQQQAAKLWADTLLCATESNNNHNAHLQPLFMAHSLAQLTLRMMHCLWTFPLPPLMLNQSRGLLICALPNGQQQYMLLHVLESQLLVLRKPQYANELISYRACKLYYRIFSSIKTDMQGQQVLQDWLDRLDVPKLSISPLMFSKLTEHLELNAQLIPKEMRHNSENEQLISSYFFYQPKQQDKLETDYETDDGHESQEEEEDATGDEHSDTDNELNNAMNNLFGIDAGVADANTKPNLDPEKLSG